ncbi:hypothetical protein LTS12_006333 [Elasticomyces elasticus]|nr:hypothetical protein LTS12_006333 [Elasticomyces elasticus]
MYTAAAVDMDAYIDVVIGEMVTMTVDSGHEVDVLTHRLSNSPSPSVAADADPVKWF